LETRNAVSLKYHVNTRVSFSPFDAFSHKWEDHSEANVQADHQDEQGNGEIYRGRGFYFRASLAFENSPYALA
jgi:hypothetical protein